MKTALAEEAASMERCAVANGELAAAMEALQHAEVRLCSLTALRHG